MDSGTYHFTGEEAIKQGATWRFHLVVTDAAGTPWSLTGYTARMQVRETASASTVLLELTTANGRLVLGGAAGTIDGEVSAADTTALTWTRGVYDLELVNGAVVTRLLQGRIELSPEVTR